MQFTGAPAGGYRLSGGASLDVPISLQIAPDQAVGALSGTVRYNPAVLRPTRCLRAGADLAFMGYCNAQHDVAGGIVRFNLVSADGLSGTLTPFTLTFEAMSQAVTGQSSPLNLALEAVTGPLGEARTWQAIDSTVLIRDPITAPRVLIGPPAANGVYTVTLGTTQTVPVWIEGVTDLGAASLSIRYNPAVAQAMGCRLRGDLMAGAVGGFCIAPTGTGTIRANLLAEQGFSGTGQVYEIVFAPLSSLACGVSTPLTVIIDNFVSTTELPIASTARHGRLDVACPFTPTPTAPPLRLRPQPPHRRRPQPPLRLRPQRQLRSPLCPSRRS